MYHSLLVLLWVNEGVSVYGKFTVSASRISLHKISARSCFTISFPKMPLNSASIKGQGYINPPNTVESQLRLIHCSKLTTWRLSPVPFLVLSRALKSGGRLARGWRFDGEFWVMGKAKEREGLKEKRMRVRMEMAANSLSLSLKRW